MDCKSNFILQAAGHNPQLSGPRMHLVRPSRSATRTRVEEEGWPGACRPEIRKVKWLQESSSSRAGGETKIVSEASAFGKIKRVVERRRIKVCASCLLAREPHSATVVWHRDDCQRVQGMQLSTLFLALSHRMSTSLPCEKIEC